jgi:hypothetical protein
MDASVRTLADGGASGERQGLPKRWFVRESTGWEDT